jgi:hypothetical protein
MPKERWVGFIKDYDGGTLMECYIHPNVDYLGTTDIVARQRAFIYSRLRQRSQAAVVYNASDCFKGGKRLATALDAPGVLSAGWTSQHINRGLTDRDRNITLSKLATLLKLLMEKVRSFRKISMIDQLTAGDNDGSTLDLNVIVDRIRDGCNVDKSSTLHYYRSRDMLRAELLLLAVRCKARFPDTTSEEHIAATQFELHVLSVIDSPDGEKKDEAA